MHRIYVGNLPYSVTETQLAEIFAPAGKVVDTAVPHDDRGRSKGFGFVSFETEEEMEEAIRRFNGTDVGGRMMRVNAAKPREESMEHPAPHPAPVTPPSDKAETSLDKPKEDLGEAEEKEGGSEEEETSPAPESSDETDKSDETGKSDETDKSGETGKSDETDKNEEEED